MVLFGFFRRLESKIKSFEVVEKNNMVGQVPRFPLCLISLVNVILECLLIVIRTVLFSPTSGTKDVCVLTEVITVCFPEFACSM